MDTELVLPMYNAHPYFPLKNFGKKVSIIHSKIWYIRFQVDFFHSIEYLSMFVFSFFRKFPFSHMPELSNNTF